MEKVQKNLETPPKNARREDYEAPIPSDLLICWRCGEVGHKKKDCTKALFCTNCGRSNHIASRCRQPFKENCRYCKRGDQTEKYYPVKRLDHFKQNQVREFQVFYGEQPRIQLIARAQRTEE